MSATRKTTTNSVSPMKIGFLIQNFVVAFGMYKPNRPVYRPSTYNSGQTAVQSVRSSVFSSLLYARKQKKKNNISIIIVKLSYERFVSIAQSSCTDDALACSYRTTSFWPTWKLLQFSRSRCE